jgi:NTP pyrophosphatase (non-canonical NTP hydrolase)
MLGLSMSDLKKLQSRVLKFRDDRNWKQFHNPKDLAISLLSEATELLDEFKWKTSEEIEIHLKTDKDAVADEVMDVLYHVLLISADLEIDIAKEFERKMLKNEAKYPVEKAKGSHKKYTELN